MSITRERRAAAERNYQGTVQEMGRQVYDKIQQEEWEKRTPEREAFRREMMRRIEEKERRERE